MVDKVTSNGRKIGHRRAVAEYNNETTTLNHKTIELNFVRQKLETFQANIIRDVEQRMQSMIEDVVKELQQLELQTTEFREFATTQHQHHTNNNWINRRTVDKNNPNKVAPTDSNASKPKDAMRHLAATQQRRELPEKVFMARESYLTALLQVDHMKTIYHIFYIIVLTFMLNSICHDYFVEDRINYGLGTLTAGFYQIEKVAVVWLMQHAFIFALFYAFKIWYQKRAKLQRKPLLQCLLSYTCLSVYIVTQLSFFYIAVVLNLKWNLPFGSASVLLLESTRLLMKMHAFVRYNAGRVVLGKLKTDNPQSVFRMPPFSSYLYFLFAPTLIYRDSYPRTSRIRWRFALLRLSEVVAIFFLYSYIHERHIKVHFENFGLEELNASTMIVRLFGMVMPNTIIFLCGFYLILHSWLNLFAELLRFGDRMFYKDWWTAANYEVYFRNWNCVVHDWLYEFIYKDLYNYVFNGSKLAASLTVFMVSAIMHEVLIGFALKLFFPVMFVCFGLISVPLVFVTKNASKTFGNTLLWFSLISGNGIIISLYSLEFFAKVNCPQVAYKAWTDYLIPVAWHCYNNKSE